MFWLVVKSHRSLTNDIRSIWNLLMLMFLVLLYVEHATSINNNKIKQIDLDRNKEPTNSTMIQDYHAAAINETTFVQNPFAYGHLWARPDKNISDKSLLVNGNQLIQTMTMVKPASISTLDKLKSEKFSSISKQPSEPIGVKASLPIYVSNQQGISSSVLASTQKMEVKLTQKSASITLAAQKITTESMLLSAPAKAQALVNSKFRLSSSLTTSLSDDRDTTINQKDVQKLLDNYAARLIMIRNRELAIPFVQELLDTMEFVKITQNHTVHVAQMAERLTNKLNHGVRLIKDTKRTMLNSIVVGDSNHQHQHRHHYHNERLSSVSTNTVLQTIIQPCSTDGMYGGSSQSSLSSGAGDRARTNHHDQHDLYDGYDNDDNDENEHEDPDDADDDNAGDYDDGNAHEDNDDDEYDEIDTNNQNMINKNNAKFGNLADQINEAINKADFSRHYDQRQIEIVNYSQQRHQNRTRIIKHPQREENEQSEIANRLLAATISKAINFNGNNLKNMYYLAIDDLVSDYQCNPYAENIHLRKLITAHIRSKQIVLLVDHGSSLNGEQLDLTITFANRLIDMLSDQDTIGLVAISDKSLVFTLPSHKSWEKSTTAGNGSNSNSRNKLQHFFHSATMDNKNHIKKFLTKLNRTKDITNHTLGFQIAFQQLNAVAAATTTTTMVNVDKIEERLLPLLSSSSSADSIKPPILLIYISRGLLSPLTEAKSVLKAIAYGQQYLPVPIIINTCAIVLDEKRVMYEKQFLNDVAMQNYTKYNINVSAWLDRTAMHNGRLVGQMLVVQRRYSNDLRTKALAVFLPLYRRPYLINQLILHRPVVDVDNDVVVSMATTFSDIGLIGIDFYMNDIAEEIIYYRKYGDSYAFLIDLNGMVIWHPSYPRPYNWQRNPYDTNIHHFERYQDFVDSVLKRMLGEISGTAIIFHNGKQQSLKIKYTWHRASHFYVICIVVIQKLATTSENDEESLSDSSTISGTITMNRQLHKQQQFHRERQQSIEQLLKDIDDVALIYHRLDLIRPPLLPVLAHYHQNNHVLCTHFRLIATMESSTLFLSTAAFKSPFVYWNTIHKGSRESCIDTAKSIMAYIKDSTALLANPGLQPQVKNDVITLLHIMAYLKKRHTTANDAADFDDVAGIIDDNDDNHQWQKYIIRRYVATVNGVLQIYPGCMLNSDMEPLHRPWFRKAMEHVGRIVVTSPYLDAGGAGYIVTIAHTIFEGLSNGMYVRTDSSHNDRSAVIGIVAIDVTMGFLYKMLYQSANYCAVPHVKCFLIEDKGYLVAHPSISEPRIWTMGGNGGVGNHGSSTSTNGINDSDGGDSENDINRRYNRRRMMIMHHTYDHLTHRESYVANDILHHRQFVRKRMCHNYFNRTKQRFYQFNITYNGIITNIVPNDRITYQMAHVTGTNLFVGMVNATVAGGAFCPCSTIDRQCLNCNRMDAGYCECPCECPLQLDRDDYYSLMQRQHQHQRSSSHLHNIDRDDVDVDNHPTDICEWPMDGVDDTATTIKFYTSVQSATLATLAKHDRHAPPIDGNQIVEQCLNINCDRYTTFIDCLGVQGCEWCQVDIDGDSLFQTPFCAQQSACFNGVLGSLTPYDDNGANDGDGAGDFGATIIDTIQSPPAYSAIGPVAGAIIVLCLVIGFAMYCYRQNLESESEQLYGESQAENNLAGMPLSRLDFNDMGYYGDGGGVGGGTGGGIGGGASIGFSGIGPTVTALNNHNHNICSNGGASINGHGSGSIITDSTATAIAAVGCRGTVSGILTDSSNSVGDICDYTNSNRYLYGGHCGNSGNSMTGGYSSPNHTAMSDISPYRINTGILRRPNGESDHGYSTMTPHDDSEHNCFGGHIVSAADTPLLQNRCDKRLSITDDSSTSCNTSISSHPSNYAGNSQPTTGTISTYSPKHKSSSVPSPIITTINDKHVLTTSVLSSQLPASSSPYHIQASVTVHHPMEMS